MGSPGATAVLDRCYSGSDLYARILQAVHNYCDLE